MIALLFIHPNRSISGESIIVKSNWKYIIKLLNKKLTIHEIEIKSKVRSTFKRLESLPKIIIVFLLFGYCFNMGYFFTNNLSELRKWPVKIVHLFIYLLYQIEFRIFLERSTFDNHPKIPISSDRPFVNDSFVDRSTFENRPHRWFVL